MAEGGDIAGLVADVNALGATVVANPAGGLLAPASSTTFSMNTDGTSNDRLSIVAMLLPTNDAFAGLNAVEIPTEPGTYVFNVNAYDAGTEANDELLTGGGASGVPGMPADPGRSCRHRWHGRCDGRCQHQRSHSPRIARRYRCNRRHQRPRQSCASLAEPGHPRDDHGSVRGTT